MKLNSSKTRVTTFTRKTNFLHYTRTYKLWDSSITHTDTIKDLGVRFDSKLHCHACIDCMFSQSIRMLGLIRTINYSFSTLVSLLTLYLTFSRLMTDIYIYIYICRTAPLTSRRFILDIYSTSIRTEYFKHAAHSPFFPLQNAIYFIMLPFLFLVLFTF
jgi:hypothetical protein